MDLHTLSDFGPKVLYGVALGIILTRQTAQERRLDMLIQYLQLPYDRRSKMKRALPPLLLGALAALLASL